MSSHTVTITTTCYMTPFTYEMFGIDEMKWKE